MARLIVALISTIFLGSSYAGDFNSKIEHVQVNVNHDSAIVKFQVDPTDNANCVGSDLRMTVDLSTTAGRAVYSMTLTAHSAGKAVFGKGRGICEEIDGLESIKYIRILQ